ncbi:hypothetical protein CKM354_000895800 [Cercospora kikuchii]|uniref:Heterokaryon incompatibility domain-containing protein n=1 Tax=Cercospora kikuchii TaxID=84275 RepID=A0A9P3CM92_9PEZI|nr:uncharacterized protein CKM354_000895800 [Cercospora kikuchii]GIZ45807.1 hypothetical protein CKM354_000895800 [Cercospora kikuchii]
MNNVRSFRYSALSSSTKQIRLLRVLEDVSAEFDCCCEIHNFEIELAPEYDAISYTWGSETPIKTIVVNDGALQVRQNCWIALRQRGSLKKHLAWTWIDSICINQSDDEEKSGQVQMMADIYRRAGCVLISLPDSNGFAGQLSSNIASSTYFRLKVRAFASRFRSITSRIR